MQGSKPYPAQEDERARPAVGEEEEGGRSSAAQKITLFRHQEEPFTELMTTAAVAFSGRWRDLPVWPRLNQLVVGPSGSGKTALVRKVAQTLHLPFFQASTATWILTGTSGRGALQTWPSLLDFLLENQVGIIFIDEIDKVSGPSEWSSYLRTELYALLDRTVPSDLIRASNLGLDSGGDRRKAAAEHAIAQIRLRHGMMIVAAGAFEAYWSRRSSRPIGFADAAGAATGSDRPALKDFHDLLPVELANRFRAKVVYLKPRGLSGYLQMLRQTAEQLPGELVEPFLELGCETAVAAFEARLGPRWIEELVTEVLCREVKAKIDRRVSI